MSKPETKTVLGRVFERDGAFTRDGERWRCRLTWGWLVLAYHRDICSAWVELFVESGPFVHQQAKTDVDAILALQSTLRKMAELEVVG